MASPFDIHTICYYYIRMKRAIDIPPIKQTWEDLSFKERMSYVFATGSFALGWVITFIGFFLPPMGEVHETVLWILGQALLFTGAVIGIGQYYNSQVLNFKKDIMHFIKKHELAEEESQSIE